jgi:hypothetical protein
MVRTAAPTTVEDDPDVSKAGVRLDRFEALVRGYLGTADFLNEAEKTHLAFAGKLLTLECGIRFLTDFLEGDIYFKIDRDAHNLDRCRTRLKLVEHIENQMKEMDAFVRKVSRGRR